MQTKENPKPGSQRYTVKWNAAGQPSPYADTIYDFEVLNEWVPYGKAEWEPRDMVEDLFVKVAKAIGNNWHDDGNWPGPRLKSKTKIAPGHWRFIVICDFTH